MNLVDVSNRLLELFRHELSTAEVRTFENNIAAGEAWLVVYDLITWAIDTNHDVPADYLQFAADAAADHRAFGRLSESFRATLLAQLHAAAEVGPVSRFTEGYKFFGEKPAGPPASLPILLHRLGVYFDSTDVQHQAVVKWLETNEPTGRLARELRVFVNQK